MSFTNNHSVDVDQAIDDAALSIDEGSVEYPVEGSQIPNYDQEVAVENSTEM